MHAADRRHDEPTPSCALGTSLRLVLRSDHRLLAAVSRVRARGRRVARAAPVLLLSDAPFLLVLFRLLATRVPRRRHHCSWSGGSRIRWSRGGWLALLRCLSRCAAGRIWSGRGARRPSASRSSSSCSLRADRPALAGGRLAARPAMLRRSSVRPRRLVRPAWRPGARVCSRIRSGRRARTLPSRAAPGGDGNGLRPGHLPRVLCTSRGRPLLPPTALSCYRPTADPLLGETVEAPHRRADRAGAWVVYLAGPEHRHPLRARCAVARSARAARAGVRLLAEAPVVNRIRTSIVHVIDLAMSGTGGRTS